MNQPKREYGIILLAAGSSSRMGQSKQLLDIHGEPLLRRILIAAVASMKDIVVVLGSDPDRHRSVISDLPVDIVINPDWQKGMGNSLKAGLKGVLAKNSSIAGVVVLVCDQPKVDERLINNIIFTYERTGKPLVASQYEGTIGVPAFFERKYFNALASLGDNHGAKSILLRNPDDVVAIDFPEGSIDLDTMNDYRTYMDRG